MSVIVTLLGVIGTIMVVGGLVAVWALRRAPEAFEDRNGFHLEPEQLWLPNTGSRPDEPRVSR